MGEIEIKIRENRKFWFNMKVVKSQVLYTSIIMVFFPILFAGCKKVDDGSASKEDLSYLIKTYYRYETSSHEIIKQTWSYDGYKPIEYKYYVDGQLLQETKNYSYNGLNASYDSYTYRDSVTNRQHVECEYLDETFRRTKYSKSRDSQNNLYETYYEYDGKKKLSQKSYTNGMLTDEIHYSYEDLRCTYTTTDYNYDNTIWQERSYEILYLDDTYLREKSRLQTRKRYDTDGNLTFSHTYYYVYDFDDKKPIGYQYYYDGKLSAIARDYQYDGLNCIYFLDNYRDGEVYSSSLYEVEYLK
jgi:hypothetical protein